MTKWNGLCPAGKHGLDHKGQHCNLCDKPHPSADSPGGQRNIVGGERMERTVVDFVHACEVEVERIAASPFGDNAVLALLCDSVRLAREHVAMFQADPRDAELSSLRERLAGAEEQSEARRRALLAVGDERRVEWTRAENAESERDAALAKLAEAEKYVGDLAAWAVEPGAFVPREKFEESERGAAAFREALAVAHDAMVTWCSSEWADHPLSLKVKAALAHPAGKGFVRRAKRAKDVDPSFPYCAACGGTVNDHLAPDGGGCEGMFIGAALQPVTEGE
jgi:hypothetical protein